MIDLLNAISKLSYKKDGEAFCELFSKIKIAEIESPGEIEKLGWVESFFTNSFFKKEDAVPVYSNYSQFKSKIPTGFIGKNEIDPALQELIIFNDEINKALFVSYSEKRVQVIMRLEDDKFVQTAASGLNMERVFSSPVARDYKVLSIFPTYFVNHSDANKKQFVAPVGEAFGIEIEMKFPTVFSKLRFSNFIGTNYNNWITERDGSLEDKGNAGHGGLELVSPPLSYNKLVNDLKQILAEARKQKGMGHEAGVFYGIHINVNIHGQDKLNTARRFICLINDPNLRFFWETMSRRRGSAAMQEYCRFQNVTFDTCLTTESNGHYRATYYRTDRNGQPTNCVEVRIFRSNLKFSSVQISLEITKLALDFVMNPDNVINDYASFRKFIEERASDDLKKYIYASKAIECLDRAANLFTTNRLGATLENFA